MDQSRTLAPELILVAAQEEGLSKGKTLGARGTRVIGASNADSPNHELHDAEIPKMH